jgi:hypothetical protein
MTKEELAAKIDGSIYTTDWDINENPQLAKDNGLVIVYGHSDDLVEFIGTIDEEIGAYRGKTIYLNGKGICKKKKANHHITADYTSYWNILGTMPHAKFQVVEDEDSAGPREVQCKGIVFHINDLK